MLEFSMKLGRRALLGTMAAVAAAPSLPASAAEGEEINWWVTDPSKVTATAFIAELEKQTDLLAPALPRLSGSPRLAHAPA
jgi:hypothetical protein